MKEQLQFVVEVLNQFDEVQKIIDSAKEKIKPNVNDLLDYWVDSKARMVKRFQDEHGFTKDESILLTLDAEAALKRIDRQKKGVSK